MTTHKFHRTVVILATTAAGIAAPFSAVAQEPTGADGEDRPRPAREGKLRASGRVRRQRRLTLWMLFQDRSGLSFAAPQR